MPEEFIEDILAEDNPAEEKPAEELETNSAESLDQLEEKEVKEEVADVGETSVVGETESEVTIEDLASQIGWNPNHEGEDKVDAATYILKSREIQETMRDNNKDLKNQLSTMQSSIESLKEHNENVYRADVRRMQAEVEALKREKRSAVELADVEKVDAIDKKIDNITKDLATPKQPTEAPANPIYDEWIKDNQWYLTEPDMAQFAETVAQQYNGAPLDRIYNLVRAKVAEVFPEKFESKPAVTPKTEVTKPVGPKSPVEAPTKSGNNKSTFTKADLTTDQLAIMNQFVKTGVMSEDQYIKDIAKMQEG